MYGTYQRLNLPVSATSREVIRASLGKLKQAYRRGWKHREARQAFLREMLRYHAGARELVKTFRL